MDSVGISALSQIRTGITSCSRFGKRKQISQFVSRFRKEQVKLVDRESANMSGFRNLLIFSKRMWFEWVLLTFYGFCDSVFLLNNVLIFARGFQKRFQIPQFLMQFPQILLQIPQICLFFCSFERPSVLVICLIIKTAKNCGSRLKFKNSIVWLHNEKKPYRSWNLR